VRLMALSQSYKDIVQKVIGEWQWQSELNPGATDAQLHRFESANRISLPEDLRYLYSQANGMLDVPDNHFFTFWPLENIVEYHGLTKKTIDDHEFTEIAFGDFLIDSYRYSLVIDEEGKSSIWMQSQQISADLEEFLNRWISDPKSLCLM